MIATIAVASGKGGVGKSTVSVNLAVALAQRGASVGLMDADVYGPNIPIMMGLRRIPRAVDRRIIPPEAFGVKLMSMGFLVDADRPLVWRGPMLHKSLQQLLAHTDWGEVEYVLIDLPPGTGDVQLTLAQSISLTGAIIVTTPQAVALGDVRKGVAAFQQLNVPLIGVVENMSYYHCPHCGHEAHIFAHGGGREAAENYQVPFLGEIPLDIAVREGGDRGTPVVATAPDSAPAVAIRQIAEAAVQRIEMLRVKQPRDSLVQITGL
jgi:ATP-binding protein involved in chromosome partitioning